GRKNLAQTQLLGEGTIASHSVHVRLKPVENAIVLEWQKELTQEFDDPAVRVSLPQDTSEQTARSGKLFGDYLQLASLVALILAVVGTFYLFRTLVHRRLKDVAILRALGVSSLKARELLLLPLLLDFLLALPLAGLFSAATFPLITKVLAQLFSTVLPMTSFPWSVTLALPFILAMVLMSLMPAVEEAVRAPVMGLLQDQEKSGVVPLRFSILYVVGALASLVGLSIWAAHSVKIGLLFVAGLMVAILVLTGATLLLRLIGESILKRSSSLSAGVGLMTGLVIRRLLRKPVTTLLSVIALGLGSVLISLLGHLELSIGQEFSLGEKDRPSLFLFDIQDEQTEPLRAYLGDEKVPLQAISPMVRGKLVAVNEEPFKKEKSPTMFQTREEENEARFRQRMMNLSWATGLNESERIVEGVDFKDAKVKDGEAPLSLERRFAQRLGINLGDMITFEILGVPLVGRVVNLRSVKWTSFRPNFFITFAPGFLEEAPKSWLAAIGDMPAMEKARLQNSMAKKFPNISAIDVEQLTVRLMELFNRLKQALQLMAFFSFLVGIVVVSAMAQDQVIRRQAEVMLEKTLGLSPWRVTLMVMGEFLGLALLAFTLGGLAGAGIAGLLTVYVFEGEMIWSYQLLISLTLGGMLLVSLPLLFMARRIFTWRPAGLLQGA
ncbi:MAG: ABC transporter permease, partial [Bacteriovoracia bacterium]